MNKDIARALKHDRVIDITTTGRQSGEPRRIEIWFHNLNDHIYITGSPGRRSWYANMLARPEFIFHLKESVRADLPARARPILAGPERQTVLAQIVRSVGRDSDLEVWLTDSPLVEVEFLEQA